MPLISLVVPCYNEEESLPLLFDELERVTGIMRTEAAADFGQDLSFEAVLVDDGSKDATRHVMAELSRKFAHMADVKWISFSRNFGKEAALYAGLANAKGDFVATIDADMQDPPSLLPEMYRILVEEPEYDDVATYRTTREGEPAIRSFFARMFYRITNKISDSDIRDGARDYRLMRRSMVDAILEMGEYNRFSKGIYGWVGFNTKWIPFQNVERVAGDTKWSFGSLFSYSIEGIVSFSTKPLQVASVVGIVFCVLAVLYFIFIVARTLLFGDPVSGWPSLACIILLVGGIQLLCMGIFGQYLARVYLETKNRPIYIIARTNIED